MRRRLMSGGSGIKATLIQQIDTQAGDVVFADPNSDSKVYYRLDDGNDIIPKSFVPIGVVVIPALHDVYGTGACGVLSLKQMSNISPETGTTEWNDANSWLFVGDYKDYIENDLKDFCYVGGNGIVNKEVQGINPRGEGYLPTNMMIGINNPYDTKTYYYSSARFCSPSPYNEDGSRNPAYYQISSPSSTENALAYFNGRENTQIITSEYDNPAIVEVCCSLYKTEGTKQGDWYFPSIAELGYVPPRINFIINAWNILSQYYEDIIQYPIEEEPVSLGLTSTFYYQDPYIVRVDGSIFAIPKDWGGTAFAFTQIGTLDKNYGDIYISGGTVSDIPASGGESQVTGYTYSQTYGYGDSTTNGGTITSGANIEVTSVSADTLGTTEKERTKIGYSVLTVTMNGKTVSASYEVYQEANVKTATSTSGGVYSYGNISAGSITNATIGAGGGSATAYAGNGSQSWSRTAITTNYSYTSGATSSAVTTTAQSGTNSINPSASSYTASANSKGTSVSGVTTVGSKYITWSANGKSTGGTMYVYQAANAITSYGFIGSASTHLDNAITFTISNQGRYTTIYNNGTNKASIYLKYNRSDSMNITISHIMTAYYTSGESSTVDKAPNEVIFGASNVGGTVSGSYPNYTLSLSSVGGSINEYILDVSVRVGNTSTGFYYLYVQRTSY